MSEHSISVIDSTFFVTYGIISTYKKCVVYEYRLHTAILELAIEGNLFDTLHYKPLRVVQFCCTTLAVFPTH